MEGEREKERCRKIENRWTSLKQRKVCYTKTYSSIMALRKNIYLIRTIGVTQYFPDVVFISAAQSSSVCRGADSCLSWSLVCTLTASQNSRNSEQGDCYLPKSKYPPHIILFISSTYILFVHDLLKILLPKVWG